MNGSERPSGCLAHSGGSRWHAWQGQALLLLVAWSVACLLYRSTDGLWFQGDAPRHALNGLFYHDLAREVLTHGGTNVRDYAERYYVRYPAICPTHYPPLFYLMEAVGYALVGPQWWVGKTLCMLTGLVAGGYMIAWLRRWVGAPAGWLAPLLLGMPGVATWMNAAMLNVPASALGFGALYHLRRALEARDRGEEKRQITWAFALATCGVLTHPVAGVVLLVGLAWVVALRRWGILVDRRVWLVALLALLAIVPAFYILNHFGGRLNQVAPGTIKWSPVGKLWFYPRALSRLCGQPTLLAAALGLVVGIWQPRWRREVGLILIWCIAFYLGLTFIWAKSGRYALVLGPAMVVLVAIFVHEFRAGAGRIMSAGNANWLAGGLATAIVCGQGADLVRQPPPDVSLVREVAAFVKQVAPREAVFYRGQFDGTFIFYLRLDDPAYERQVVSLFPWLREKARKANVDLLSQEGMGFSRDAMMRSGIRWLISDRPPAPGTKLRPDVEPPVLPMMRHPGFRLARSFRCPGPPYAWFDVYEIQAETEDGAAIEPPAAVPRLMFGRMVEPMTP